MQRLLRSCIPGAVLIAVLASGPAAVAASPGPAGTTAAPRAAAPAVKVCGAGAALTRPRSMVLTCADDGELAEHLNWSSWTGTRATATGVVTWRACAAHCADSRTWDSARADFTLTEPVPEPGKRVLFTRLKLHVTGRTPRGFLRDLAFDEAPVPSSPPVAQRPGSGRPGPRPSSLPPAAPSGTLGYVQIEGFWIDAGGPDSPNGSYTDAQIAAAITGAESSFEPGIIQPGVDYCGAGSDRAGWGLWQITCGNSVPAYGTDFQLLDPWNNAEAAVSKYNADVAAGDNGFDPWSTYTDGAYQSFLQTTAADTQLTDPGEYVQINSTPAGTPASPAADPGSTYGPPMPGQAAGSSGPVVYDPASGKLEAYAIGSDGSLEQRAWSASSGWSGWINLGGSVTGTPSAIYDPVTGHLEVYAQGANGPLFQKYWSPGAGWSAWINLGSSITGSPDAIYDPASGRLEVYAVSSGGALEQIAFASGSGWSGWINLAGSVTGNPSPVYDPVTGHLEAYLRGANGPLFQKYWTPGAGWSAWINLGSTITGSPDAVYDPASGKLEVYALSSGGALEQIAFTSGSGWSAWTNLGGTLTGL